MASCRTVVSLGLSLASATVVLMLLFAPALAGSGDSQATVRSRSKAHPTAFHASPASHLEAPSQSATGLGSEDAGMSKVYDIAGSSHSVLRATAQDLQGGAAGGLQVSALGG